MNLKSVRKHFRPPCCIFSSGLCFRCLQHVLPTPPWSRRLYPGHLFLPAHTQNSVWMSADSSEEFFLDKTFTRSFYLLWSLSHLSRFIIMSYVWLKCEPQLKSASLVINEKESKHRFLAMVSIQLPNKKTNVAVEQNSIPMSKCQRSFFSCPLHQRCCRCICGIAFPKTPDFSQLKILQEFIWLYRM